MEKNTHLVTTELFGSSPNKREVKKMQFIDTAIQLFSKHGYDSTAIEQICKKLKITRPLFNHYFIDKEELFLFAIKYIRLTYQQYVVERMRRAKDPVGVFKAYLESALDWVDVRPEHAKLWLAFFHKCATNEKFRIEHTGLVDVGTSRIAEMIGRLSSGKSEAELHRAARRVQIYITGTVVSVMSEHQSAVERRRLFDDCVKNCMSL